MKLMDKKDNKIVFSTEIDESLANAIRRYLNQIPILAVDEVEISKNDSPLYDETVAHRVGLIPLKMEKSASDKKEYKIKLNSTKEGIVNTDEIKGDLKPVYDQIPITSLKKGQSLELVGIVKAGKGSDHAKFSPGLMFYRNIIDVKIDKDCPKDVVNVCPKNILKLKGGKIEVEDGYKCDMCEACTEWCKKNKKDSIKLIPKNELIIEIESFGQLDVKDVVKKSIEALKKDLSVVSKNLAK